MLRQVAFLALVAVCTAADLHCGVPVIQPQLIDLNVIGGQEVVPKSFPWQAGLYSKSFTAGGRGSHFCAGALVDNRTVITAAHCLGQSPSRVSIHLGSHQKFIKDQDEVYIDVEHFCIHPQYYGNVNDIGIIRLAQAVNYTEAIRPICLPAIDEDVQADDKLYVTGWGFTNANRRPAEVLMQARQVQITKEQCNRMRPINTAKLVCTVHTRGSSCHGDSGGPLQTKRGDYWQLTGVVSGGPPVCGTPSWPMYYSETSKFVGWINDYKKSAAPKSDFRICRY